MLLVNPRLEVPPEAELMSRYAYVVRDRNSALVGPAGASRTFRADRYGGLGQGPHAGSGRVGSDGRFEVKGIGRTPLVPAIGVDPAYATGEASAVECVLEMIWGEVLSVVLPFGAVRCLAAVDTGLPFGGAGAHRRPDARAARSLLVRELALRPAHFMRAIYARPDPRADLPPDPLRVAEAVNVLPGLLPQPRGLEQTRLSRIEQLHAGMGELAYRHARQLAVARARRFRHGSITASNLALDGRWLDFESAHHVPVFGSPRNFHPAFWYDDHGIARTIEYLSYYIDKYFDDGDPWIGTRYVDAFHRHLDAEQRSAFLGVLGIPERLLDGLSADGGDLQTLARLAVRIAKSGRTRPYCGDPSDFHAFGHYDLSDVAVRLAAASGDDERDQRLAGAIRCPALRQQLVAAYGRALSALRLRGDVRSWPPGGLEGLLLFGAAKRASQFPGLYLGALGARLEALCGEFRDRRELRSALGALLFALVDDVKIAMTDYGDGPLLLAEGPRARVGFCPARAAILHTSAAGGQDVVAELRPGLPETLSDAKALVERFRQLVA